MAVISTSFNQKTFFVQNEMPFKYREKRNAYFRDYMRKRRAEEKKSNEIEVNPTQPRQNSDKIAAPEDKTILEIVAA